MAPKRDKKLLQKRNDKIRKRFAELHKIERMRLDDVWKQLEEDEFFLSRSSLERIVYQKDTEE